MRSKKKIAIIGGVHGDEKVGAEVIRRLKHLIDGQNVVGLIANTKAFKKGKRFIVQDLNRSFPGEPKGKLEEQIAYKLSREIKKFDYVLDVHSFSCKSEPFAILTEKTKRHLKLAKASGINKIVFMSSELASGKALIDHCRCGISIEAGQHDLESTFRRGTYYTENVLKVLGFLGEKGRKVSKIDYFEVTDVFFKKGDEKLAKGVTNFKMVHRGVVVAVGREGKFVAPYDFYPVLAREKAYPHILCLAAKGVKIKYKGGYFMNTDLVYYQDPYKKELDCRVISVKETAGRLENIELDKTIFYPEGGGQPSDRGEIVGGKGKAKVEYVRMMNDRIVHQCLMVDPLTEGDKVTAKIDWEWRYKYMRTHSAGHLIHDVLMTIVDGLKPLKGSHGKKAFLEYSGSTSISLKEELEGKVNEAVEKDLPIVTKDATYEELVQGCQFVPPNLPRDKDLRILKTGDYPAMPDGGVHVKSTKEIGKVLITDLLSGEGKTVVKYRVVG